MAEKDVLTQLLLLYPGITADEVVHRGAHLRGTAKLQGRWYNFSVSVPNFPQIEGGRLCVQQLHAVRTFTCSSCSAMQPQWTVLELIANIPNVVDCDAKDGLRAPEVARQPDATQGNMYSQIAALYAPDAYQMHVNANCSRIRFCRFAHYDQHYLELALPALTVLAHSLPDGVAWQELLQKCSTLGALVEQYQKYLEELQPFYENFTDIDELCYVVQPAAVTTKHNWRMFLFSERVFLKLHIADPFAPLASMSLHIIGPTHEVDSLRRAYSDGLKDWDVELDILKNLLRIFDLCFFPMPPGNAEERSAKEQFCNICYCYRLEHGEVPVVSCDNPHCTLVFHAACLQEWFNTLSDGKQFLAVSFGACPFCKAKLSTSFSELLDK